MRTSFLLSIPLLASAAACTVGPDYDGPPGVTPGSSEATRFVRGAYASTDQPAVAQWWTGLSDPTLNQLESAALAENPNVNAAEARVRQSRAALRLERANELPSLSATGMYAHAQLPGIDLGSSGSDESGGGSGGSGSGGSSSDGSGSSDGGSTSLDFFNVGFDASWEIDLFGGQRRTVEAARATLAASEASLADAQVQLTAELAQAYVNLRDRQRRLILIRQASDLQQQMLGLTEQRLQRGTASALDVERLRTQVENTQAQAVPIEAEIEAYLDALAVLTGSTPGSLDAMLSTGGPLPLPPATVGIGDPTSLLQRRPDIRAAERQLAAATARIGSAEASRFPRLSFMGILGLGGTSLSALTDFDNIATIAMPQIQWNFLDFGRGAARVGQAQAARDEAEARYRQSVLAALQDAEDSLSRFGHRRQTVSSLGRVRESAQRAATLMQQRYRAGTATLIDALDAERQRLAAEENLAAATAALTGDYISIQKALGLGWEAPASVEAPGTR